MRRARDEGGSHITAIVVAVVVLLAVAGVAGYFYVKDHHDYANISSEQGFLSNTSANEVNFVQWQESAGGLLTGSIQTTTKSSDQAVETFNGQPSVSTASQQLSGHVDGAHVVFTTTVQGKTVTLYGTSGDGTLKLTFPADNSVCPGQGDITERFELHDGRPVRRRSTPHDYQLTEVLTTVSWRSSGLTRDKQAIA